MLANATSSLCNDAVPFLLVCLIDASLCNFRILSGESGSHAPGALVWAYSYKASGRFIFLVLMRPFGERKYQVGSLSLVFSRDIVIVDFLSGKLLIIF